MTAFKKSIGIWPFILAFLMVVPVICARDCNAEWKWQNPLPQGNTLNGVWGSSGTDVFAVGEYGTILHYNGTRWRVIAGNTTERLNAVWGSSGSDVFVVGDNGSILHYNGTGWSAMTSITNESLLGVWGSSWSDVFAVGGHQDEDGNSFATILHYDGTAWSEMTNGTSVPLEGVWGTSGSDVFAVGWHYDDYGNFVSTILHYDGTAWKAMEAEAGTSGMALYDVWGSSKNDVFAVGWYLYGGSETILHYDGSAWTEMSSPISGNLRAVWGISGTDVFAVGNRVAILRYDGTAWSEMDIGGHHYLLAVWGSSGSDVFAVGDSGVIFHYDGSAWTEMSSRIPEFTLIDIWGSSVSDVYAVGNGYTILHYDGTVWTEMSSGNNRWFHDVWGSSGSDVFAVGENDIILHYDGTNWGPMEDIVKESPPIILDNLYGVWGSSGSDVFAVGSHSDYSFNSVAKILHYDGTEWSTMTSPPSNPLYAVWGSSGSDVFAVGNAGTILHYDGTAWSEMMGGATASLSGVWGSSGSDVFAVGNAGTILHYDGTGWTEMSSPTSGILYSIWGTSGSDVFVVGYDGGYADYYDGLILHYDGTAWSEMTSGIIPGLYGIWGTSGKDALDVFAVGWRGTILHYDGDSRFLSQGPLPDTGQTEFYDDAGNTITCPSPGQRFYGQDGNYIINPPSYTKLDAGGNDLSVSATSWAMVRDNVTGLVWEVKTDDGTIHDKDNAYSWQDAQDVFIEELNTSNFGGYSDWRLPSIKELASITYLGRYNPAICTDFFPHTLPDYYWSSTTRSGNTGYAWYIDLFSGYCDWYSKSSLYYVCAVQGGHAVKSYVDNGDGTVTDTSTGLMWQQKTQGEMNWESAFSYCAGLSLGGYDDWRLPNHRELQSLADYESMDPAIDTDLFRDTMSTGYWSSTTDAGNTNGARYIHFFTGDSGWTDKSLSRYVRTVRGGQNRIPGHLVILTPVQGSSWDTENQMNITWETQDISGDVIISISRDGGREGTFETIVETTPNDGSYDWTVTGTGSFNCVLRIEPVNDPDKVTSQGLFSVTNVQEPDGGYDVTTELWARAVLQVAGNPVTLIWKEVGRDITPSGDQVISGYFYADPKDFACGSLYNPEVFVKIYIATNGWCNIAFNHVTVDDVTVYSAHNYSGTPDKTGTVSLTSRLAEHQYDGVGIDTSSGAKGRLSPVGATETGGGYIINSGLWENAVLQTPGGSVILKWMEVGADNTPTGARVVSGYFYADPADFAYGSEYNPELFVKIYIDPNGWANIASNHVTVDSVDVSSSHNYDGTPDQSGTACLGNRLVEHQYTGVAIE